MAPRTIRQYGVIHHFLLTSFTVNCGIGPSLQPTFRYEMFIRPNKFMEEDGVKDINIAGKISSLRGTSHAYSWHSSKGVHFSVMAA